MGRNILTDPILSALCAEYGITQSIQICPHFFCCETLKNWNVILLRRRHCHSSRFLSFSSWTIRIYADEIDQTKCAHWCLCTFFGSFFMLTMLSNECWHCSWFRSVYHVRARMTKIFFPSTIHGKNFSISCRACKSWYECVAVAGETLKESPGRDGYNFNTMYNTSTRSVLTNVFIFSFFSRALSLSLSLPLPPTLAHGTWIAFLL